MNESPIISRKIVRKSKVLKKIQKESKKKYGKEKFRDINNRIDKMVKLSEKNEFYDFSSKENRKRNINNLGKSEVLDLLKINDIRGLSGSGYPTINKINSVISSSNIDKYLIINGVECDPGLIHDRWLIKNRFSQIEKGVELLKKCISFKKVILATKEPINISNKLIEIRKIPNIYPMGAEKILIDKLLGVKIENDNIPSQAGILVLNVQTVISIYEALSRENYINNKSKYITIADVTKGEASVVKVDLGTNAMSILERVLPQKDNLVSYIGEGVMMAKRLLENDIITYETNFIAYGEDSDYDNESKCKGCGLCVRKCPMKIDIKNIIRAIEKGNLNKLDLHDVEKCIKCGSCSYYCKARKNTMLLINDELNKGAYYEDK